MWPLWIYREGPSLALPRLSPLGRHPLAAAALEQTHG